MKSIELNLTKRNSRRAALFVAGLSLVAACSSDPAESQPSSPPSSMSPAESTAPATTPETTIPEATTTTVADMPNQTDVIEFDRSIEYPVAYTKQEFLDLLTDLPRFDTPGDPSVEVHTSIGIIPGVMFTLNNGQNIARPILAYEDTKNIDPTALTGTGIYGLLTYDLTKTTPDYSGVRMLYFDEGNVRSFGPEDVAIATVTARPPAYVEQGIALGPQFAQVLRVGENGLIARDDCNDPDFSVIRGANYVEIDNQMVAVGAVVDSEEIFIQRRALGGVNGTCVY